MSVDHQERDGELVELLKRLADEIEVLRETVDELRDELTYELRKLRDTVSEPAKPFRLASLPRDPCAIDFHAQVNAIDRAPCPANPESPEAWLDRLMDSPPTIQMTAADWDEGHEFAPEEVAEIEGAIFDWFAENLAAIHQGPEHAIVDDGNGAWFLLWCRAERCYLRLLTTAHQSARSSLTDSWPEAISSSHGDAADSQLDQASTQRSQQQTLW